MSLETRRHFGNFDAGGWQFKGEGQLEGYLFCNLGITDLKICILMKGVIIMIKEG